jgi:hypothetical protein
MNRLSRAGIAVVLLGSSLWAGGVAEAGNLLPTVTVCVDPSSGVVSRVASSSQCVGSAQIWSASQSAPLLCWNASSLKPSDRTRVVSVAPSSGCSEPLRSVLVGRAQLLCRDAMTRVLHWPMTESCARGNFETWIRSAATPTTVPTTTSTTSTTPTTAVVVPSVTLSATTIQSNAWPKAVTVTANVAGTVYFAEGDFVVKTVSDITSAPSHRWAKGTVTSANTPTSIAIDGDVLTNGYYRVYVANSQGVLSAPATNIVTISITRASATTTTAVALTCVQGGSCTVGVDTGPGGGVVFYYSATAFTSLGSACGTNCHSLEAAPTTGSSAWTDVRRTWATNSGTTSAQSGNAVTSVSGADGIGIGTGYQNTSDIIAQIGNVAATSAAVEARAYRGPNSLSDWFLPSIDELNELCKYAKSTGDASGSGTPCTGGTSTLRGFPTDSYWSSSEYATNRAWSQGFRYGGKDIDYFFKSSTLTVSSSIYVRPVRAF